MAVTASDIARLRGGNGKILGLMNRDLMRMFHTLDLSDAYRSRDTLLAAIPQLTETYGEQAAFAAAEWYEDVRAKEGVRGNFTAQMAPTFPGEFVYQRVRYGAGHLFTESPELILPFLANALTEYVLQPGHDTITGAALEDIESSGWYRETRASSSYTHGCDFCQMLAGRGGVYKYETAFFASHGGCHCVAVPSFDPDAIEVPADAYEASTRAYRSDPKQLAAHNAITREWMDEFI